jgi:DNA-binding response OmpR family regulator
MEFEGKKILIVEDDPNTRQVLSDKFAKEGFMVIAAEDGEAGLEAAKKEKPDIMLLDVILPKMDGITLFKKIREAGIKDTPAIILTVLSDAERVVEALQEGAFSYLVKTDWSLEEVVLKVKQTLNKKQNQ